MLVNQSTLADCDEEQVTSEYSTLQALIADGIAKALSSEMVTKWVVVVESMGEDGARGVWSLAQEDMRIWDSFGLLTFALHIEQVKMLRGEGE
jgi:hypothetical protein